MGLGGRAGAGRTTRLAVARQVNVPAGERVPVSWIPTGELATALADLREERDRIDAKVAAIERVLADRECMLPSGRVSSVRHGTDAAYYYHRRIWQTPACGACKVAHAQAEAERVARRRERAS